MTMPDSGTGYYLPRTAVLDTIYHGLQERAHEGQELKAVQVPERANPLPPLSCLNPSSSSRSTPSRPFSPSPPFLVSPSPLPPSPLLPLSLPQTKEEVAWIGRVLLGSIHRGLELGIVVLAQHRHVELLLSRRFASADGLGPADGFQRLAEQTHAAGSARMPALTHPSARKDQRCALDSCPVTDLW